MSNGKTTTDFIEATILNLIEQSPEENVLNYSNSSWNKFYNGRPIDTLSRKIEPYISKPSFEIYLEDEISEDVVDPLVKEFKENGYAMDGDNYNEKIADLMIDSLFPSRQTQSSPNQKITNNYIYSTAGALVPEEINNTPIELLNDAPMAKLNSSINIANIIASSKLPEPIKPYYDAQIQNIAGKSRYNLIPKSKEAQNLFPQTITFSFSSKDNNLDHLKNIRSLLNEANRKNQYIKVGHPYKIQEKIGDYDNPFPIVSGDVITDAALYIGPVQDPKTISISLYLSNNLCSFKMDHVSVQLLEVYDDYVRFSNLRSTDSLYDIYFDAYATKINLYISARTDTVKFASVWLNIYKYRLLIADKSTYARLTVDGVKKPLFETPTLGQRNYSSKDVNNIKSMIEDVEKLIEIEDFLNMHFVFSYPEFEKNRTGINILFHALKRKRKAINKTSEWISMLNTEQESKVVKGSIINLDAELSFIEIFDIRIPLKDTRVFVKEAEILNIEKDENGYKLLLSSKKAQIYPSP